MFFSLNKKFIYTITIFFLFTASLFVYTFYEIYGGKIKEEQKSAFTKNQQFVELLYDNVNMRSDIVRIMENNPNIKISPITKQIIEETDNKISQETLTREQKRVAEMTQDYNERYQALQEAGKMVIASAILMILSIFLLWLLIRRWVVAPINKFSQVSDLVASGTLSSRIREDNKSIVYDEFDKLAMTFNTMLDNLESNIKEIKDKEVFLQSLIDGVPDGIRVINDKGKTIITNKEYKRQIKSVKKNQNNLYNQYLAVNTAELKTADNITYTVESIRDLSEDINFMHQQKLSSLGMLGTSIAHEMKNQLGSIRIIIEGVLSKFYKKVPDNDEAKKYLTLVNKEIVECSQIPEILLKLAQYSQKDVSLINCVQNIKEVTALLDYEAKKNGLIIKINTQKNNISIMGIEADFKIIMLNLAQNAFKAMKSNGTLTFNISEDKKKVKIEVSDTGKGIPKENLDKIFKPFYSDDEESGKKNRTGLGLAIVKLIVEKSKGDIKVKSEIEKGTTFTLTFPTPPNK